jgi:3-oxoacyl-[acyl-carrier protein] reductase
MKTMLITGGTGAIGSMTAYWGAKNGWRILLAYHKNHEAAKNLQEDLQKLGAEMEIFSCDLCQEEGRRALADFAAKEKSIDLLVNNFGVAHYREFSQETEETIRQTLDTNLFSHLALTHLILPMMLRQKSGAIINISSVWGQTGGSCEVAYSAAKAGLIGFTKALAKELAPSGITVNCVAPGVVESKMLGDLDRDALREMIPTGQLCSGLDIAKSILFLAEQPQITGQVLAPNGGLYI